MQEIHIYLWSFEWSLLGFFLFLNHRVVSLWGLIPVSVTFFTSLVYTNQPSTPNFLSVLEWLAMVVQRHAITVFILPEGYRSPSLVPKWTVLNVKHLTVAHINVDLMYSSLFIDQLEVISLPNIYQTNVASFSMF